MELHLRGFTACLIRLGAGRVLGGLMLCLCMAHVCAAQASAEPDESVVYNLPLHTSNITDPMRPLQAMAINERVQWKAAVALLADPQDTRLGRSFDIQVSTLIRSFQFEGYVLQGHALPWRLQPATKDDKFPPDLYQRVPGVLVFRRDDWRESRDKPLMVSYFVMFLVGESPVFGVQRVAFCRALAQARALNAGGPKPQVSDDRDLHKRGCEAEPMSPPRLPEALGWSRHQVGHVPVLGPMFSGSLTSLADVARRGGFRLNLLSPSATVDSNARISKLISAGIIHYRTYATWTQGEQLNYLFTYLFEVHAICPGEVVILAEESSFGQGALTLDVEETEALHKKCSNRKIPRRMQFSQNIAAIRAEHAQVDAKHQGDIDLSLTPKRYLELDMKNVEASPDLPPVYQPALTSRSDDLALQQLMDTLATRTKPKAVLIVATDVRDRLFMLGVLRTALPATLPAVLEGDHLLAHPDYRSANRGTVMVRNGQMNVCLAHYTTEPLWRLCGRLKDRGSEEVVLERRFFSFPTDYAANLFVANRALLLGYDEETSNKNSSPLSLITLAGTQNVRFEDAKGNELTPVSSERETIENRRLRRATSNDTCSRQASGGAGGSGSTLIAADLRLLGFNALIPLGLVASALMVLASAWLWFSSRPGRTILPLLQHAMRETGWWLSQRMHHENAPREYERNRQGQAERRRRVAKQCAALLLVLAVVVCLALAWQWLLMLAAARPPLVDGCTWLPRTPVLELVHGRAMPMVLILFGAYLWFAVVVVARLEAWNQRCHQHWEHGTLHKGRNPHAQRNYHVPAFGLALLMAGPPFLAWCVREPQTVDHTGLTTAASFLIMLACLYFLVQAWLQCGRLFYLGRDVLDRAMAGQPEVLVPSGWPTPRQLREPACSPITVQFRDRDWRALETGGDRWPIPPPAQQTSRWLLQYQPEEVSAWRARTVAEMKFGLVCIRSCLGGAFAGPLVVLAMIQVYPFAFEWEHSVIALCVLGLAFVATAYITYRTEQAPLIGQMFTQDGAHVSPIQLVKALGGKLLVMLAILGAMLAPNLSDSLQGVLGMLRF